MPEWLTQLFSQFPIVTVVAFVAWYAYREVKRVYADTRAHERAVQSEATANLKAAYDQNLAAKEAEVARLSKDFKDELRKLTKTVSELKERLDP